MPGTVLGAGDTAENKPAEAPLLLSSPDSTVTAIALPLSHSSPHVLAVNE